jgi:hypothetical protein
LQLISKDQISIQTYCMIGLNKSELKLQSINQY